MAVQSFGSGLKSHVHYHILVSDGVYFPDGGYWPLGFLDQPSLLSELRRAILKSLVARKCLQPETAKLLESWHPISPKGESSPRTPSGPLERSGFSAFVGSPINQPADRPRLERVLRYIFRPSLPLKHLSYVEATGEVRYAPPRAIPKVWSHAYDFLSDWVQHIPRARQHQVTYAGCFANALGKLNPKPEQSEPLPVEEPRPSKWVRWRTLILRCWAAPQGFSDSGPVGPSGGLYPARHRSPPPPDPDQVTGQESPFSEPDSQVPANWDEWEAA